LVPGDHEVFDPLLRHEGLEGAVGDFFRRLLGKKSEEADEHKEHQKIKKELGALFHENTSI
jgi:hypothetical protein